MTISTIRVAADPPVGQHPWYAVRVRSRFEKATAAALRGKGFEEFLPVYKRRSRWSDRTKDVESPLFPGYLFARFDARRLSPILSLPGVVHVVGTGRVPESVDESEIAAVRLLIDSRLNVEPWPYIKAGQRVRIDNGPLSGLEGCYVTAKSSHRLVLTVTMLQRSVAVEIDSAWVSPSPASQASGQYSATT